MRYGPTPIDPAFLIDIRNLPTEIVNLAVYRQCGENLIVAQDIRKHPLYTAGYASTITATHGQPHPAIGQVIQLKVGLISYRGNPVIADTLEKVEVFKIRIHHIHTKVLRWRQHGRVKVDHERIYFDRFKFSLFGIVKRIAVIPKV